MYIIVPQLFIDKKAKDLELTIHVFTYIKEIQCNFICINSWKIKLQLLEFLF